MMQDNLIEQVLAEVLRSKQTKGRDVKCQSQDVKYQGQDVKYQGQNAAPKGTDNSYPPVARPNYQREKAMQRQARLMAGAQPATGAQPAVGPNAAVTPVNQVTESLLQKLMAGDSGQSGTPQVESRTGRTFGQVKFIGTAYGNTLGYVIPNLDPALRSGMGLDAGIRAVGVISSRDGAAPQILAADEAVKKTNSRILTLRLSRDGQGGTGHGAYILLGAEDVADVARAVEIVLETVNDLAKGVFHCKQGSLEVHYTARSAEALEKAFGAPLNRAFGIMIGAPAGVGLLMADTALKTAQVELVKYWGPSVESAFANEVWLMVSGDPAAVQNALEAAREVGMAVLK